jgi:hypothetical protein
MPREPTIDVEALIDLGRDADLSAATEERRPPATHESSGRSGPSSLEAFSPSDFTARLEAVLGSPGSPEVTNLTCELFPRSAQ